MKLKLWTSRALTRVAVFCAVAVSGLVAVSGALADGTSSVDWSSMTTSIQSEVLAAIAAAMLLAVLILSVKIGFRIYRYFAK
jgi:hypothetical protein